MPHRPRRNHLPLIGAIALLLGVLALGIFLGGHPAMLPPFARAWFQSDDGRLTQDVYATIHSDFYRKVPDSRILNGALAGAVGALDDPYAHYYSPADYGHFQQMSDSEFTGIGVDVTHAVGGLKVVRVMRGTPAQRAGIEIGDVITAVDGHSLAGRSLTGASSLIRGRAGTALGLTVVRRGDELQLHLRRAKIQVPVVRARMLHRGGVPVADIALSSFTVGAHAELRRAVDRERRRGARGIVLDLRGNGGGLVEEAVLIASIFVPQGTIVSTSGRSRPRHVYTATGDAIPTSVPMVVLVDRGTASAAEILTAALEDHHRATVVGTRTYGKGVFQEVKSLPGGAAIELTVGEYFTPNGRNLGAGGVKRGRGVIPQVHARDNPKTRRDEALRAALRTLDAKIS